MELQTAYTQHDGDAVTATITYGPESPAPNGHALKVEYGTADDLFSAAKPKPSELFIPEVGKTFFVRVISGKERDAYEQSLVVGRGPNSSVNMRNARAKLAALALATPDGSRMFADADAGRLGDLPAIVLERIFDRARKINGLTADDTDTAAGN